VQLRGGCSTPFGIIGILTRTVDEASQEASRAQRLSASSEFSQVKTGDLWEIGRVLNAFRHHRNSHNGIYGWCQMRRRVLNAFRHHRNSHVWPVLNMASPANVLNAFRHHRNSHMRAVSSGVGAVSVLNAFRHHRNSHSRLPAPPPTRITSAQRLSASSEFSRVATANFTRAIICAQRLSASSEFSLSTRAGKKPCLPVLNAFRHHRNSHRGVTLFRSSSAPVLNAFRHHRNSHHQKDISFYYIDMCSTPFGIIGILTHPQTFSCSCNI